MSASDRLPAGLTMLIDATRTGQVPGGDVVRASQNDPHWAGSAEGLHAALALTTRIDTTPTR
ncbi:hypothetical protein Rruber_05426 (plasmid) [Rhodococcus ruber]|uniref:hypothetical protein n=1 Tax=Rhodococcus ruber TaxID=1830 RepID=UPI00315D85DB